MFSPDNKACWLKIICITGVICDMPVVIASSPAIDDLSNINSIMNTSADSIRTMGDSNSSWNLFGDSNASGTQMGTACLVNNITTTILKSKFQLDTNMTSWLLSTEIADPANPQLNSTLWTPTLPLSSSLTLPSALPTSTLILASNTTELTMPYIDCVSSISNLSASLIARGRTWHSEMNYPVYQAIEALQQGVSIFQLNLLQNELIRSQAIIRTIRASSTLEDAKQAWSRFLNLPGRGGSTDGSDEGTSPNTPTVTTRFVEKRRVVKAAFTPTVTRLYTHQELWNRNEMATLKRSNRNNAAVNKKHAAGNDRCLRSFTA